MCLDHLSHELVALHLETNLALGAHLRYALRHEFDGEVGHEPYLVDHTPEVFRSGAHGFKGFGEVVACSRRLSCGQDEDS